MEFRTTEFLTIDLSTCTKQEKSWIEELDYDDLSENYFYVEKSEIRSYVKELKMYEDNDPEEKKQVNFYNKILGELRDSQEIVLFYGKY